MTEGMIHHTFKVQYENKKFVRDLEVPFSEDEIKILEPLWDIKQKWDPTKGSGLERELAIYYVEIPWAGMLKEREVALDVMRLTIKNIREVRQKHGQKPDFAHLSGDLDTIENGLLQIVPDMMEDKK